MKSTKQRIKIQNKMLNKFPPPHTIIAINFEPALSRTHVEQIAKLKKRREMNVNDSTTRKRRRRKFATVHLLNISLLLFRSLFGELERARKQQYPEMVPRKHQKAFI
jgi:hypothetical protein